MGLSTVGIVVVSVAAAVALIVIYWAWRSRRAISRRLVSVTARLGSEGLDPEGGEGIERSLERLEQLADAIVTRLGDAEMERDRLHAAVASISQGVVLCDERGHVVFRNEQAHALIGDDSADALAQRELTELLKAAMEGHSNTQLLELYGPPRRTLSLSAFPLDDEWRSHGALAIVEDVTERRLLEAVRRDFVSNISHELKTPVGALALLAETLAGEEDKTVVHRLARRLQTESQRVARVVDDLLDLSRIEAEEKPLREPIPMPLVVAQAVERVRQVAETRRIRLDVHESSQRMAVLGDRRQLVSAVYNLLENAVKYSDDGSTVEVGSRTDGSVVEVRVRDHGIGIPTRDLERIFERFYRVDRARARDTGGTGLGLAIVRHVASNHGGEVDVESHEGRGSTFTIRLPAGPDPVPSEEAGGASREVA